MGGWRWQWWNVDIRFIAGRSAIHGNGAPFNLQKWQGLGGRRPRNPRRAIAIYDHGAMILKFYDHGIVISIFIA